MSKFTVKVVTNTPHNWAEGPFWEEHEGVLYYADAFLGDVCKLNTNYQTLETKHFGNGVTTIVIPMGRHVPNEFVVSFTKKLLYFNWQTNQISELCEIEAGNDKTRLNGGKCDPAGRLWMGSMGLESSPAVVEPDLGSLYRITKPGDCTKHFDNVSLSNGLAWSHDSRYMFFVDSVKRIIHVFDFDIQNGEISNNRVLFDYNANPDTIPNELPNGMTIDLNGMLWVANYNGGRLVNIDPYTAQLIDTIDLPATKVTSLCFGGPNLNELYVTSAFKGLTDEESMSQPLAGSVFNVTMDALNIRGAINNRFIPRM